MPAPRYLFGPLSATLDPAGLAAARARGECRTFAPPGGPPADHAVPPDATWAGVAADFPPGWAPDFVALWLPYQGVPPGLLDAPVPVVGLAPDWPLLGRAYRALLPRLDRILTDRPGVAAMTAAGLDHARPANLFGLSPAWLDEPPDAPADRDVDVLFVGNLHPAVQRGRLGWLGRLAQLSARHDVMIRTGVFGADYRALMRRAKLVFNRSARGECNQRALEAVAAGAVLLQEAENAEVPDYLEPGAEYAPYTAADFEAVVDRLLADAAERGRIAARARARLPDLTFAALWDRAVAGLAADLPQLRARATARRSCPRPWAAADLAAAAAGGEGPGRLAAYAAAHPDDPVAVAALGALDPNPAAALAALDRAAAAWDSPAVHADRAEALIRVGRPADAAAAAEHGLRLLGPAAGWGPADAAVPPWPPGYDHPRVAWEAAAWEPDGGATAARDLCRWRLHALLGRLTGGLHHRHAAADLRPDLAAARAALGCGLAAAGRQADALPHLRAAAEADPFDRAAARAYAQALADAADHPTRATFVRGQQLLYAAAPAAVPAEGWFETVPPTGGELASLVVLCCNELDVTRLCLESIARHARRPYELVVVDNGSADGTPSYLEAVRGWAGPDRVVVIRNDTNRGFPAGVNQGLAAARGEYVVLLNNDVVVTPGWLGGLVDAALAGWPGVGLAGPVTNYAGGAQRVPAGYPDLGGLDAFAAARRVAFGHRIAPTPRLTGFCLLVRRAVLDAVGGLDERFGLGFFDDDDLCRRAAAAGFSAVIAEGVYVHHFGSRTFRGLGVDTAKQLRDNLGLFRDKWGAEATRGYVLPDGPPTAPPSTLPPAATVPASPRGRPRVSLSMIVRDEEHNLGACLRSVAGLFDEIVVVDTGSADRTRELARSLGATVSEFPWVDNFAAARNASLDRCGGEYVFWLDADDRVDPDNRAKLAALFAALPPAGGPAYVVKCVCAPGGDGDGSATAVDHVRLFPRDPRVRWTYRVHEQILPALRRAGVEVRWSDAAVRHVGYQDPAVRRRKLARDLRLLRAEEREGPTDPFVQFNLGAVLHELGDDRAAASALEASLAGSHPKDSIVRKAYALLAGCRRRAGDRAGALAACRAGRAHYPDDAELLFVEAGLRREAGDAAAAEGLLRRLVGGSEGAHFASVDTALRGAKGRHNLAALLLDGGRAAEAAAEWRAAAAADPGFLPAWAGLGEAGCRAGDAAAVAAAVGGLRELGAAGAAEAAAVDGRWRLARGELDEARAGLAAAADRFPGHLGVRVLLSHALLKLGDPGTEAALRAVLALDPGHREAAHNLRVLLAGTVRPAPTGA